MDFDPAAWDDLLREARDLRQPLLQRGFMLGCAESCSGGLIAAAITSLSGSSQWFERGLVTYSNRAKQDLLGVPDELLQRHGAVSNATARAMATGLLRRAPLQAALAVTGIAGPEGGSADKPVGLVWFGWAWLEQGQPRCESASLLLPGDRQAVRLAAAAYALRGMRQRLQQTPATAAC